MTVLLYRVLRVVRALGPTGIMFVTVGGLIVVCVVGGGASFVLFAAWATPNIPGTAIPTPVTGGQSSCLSAAQAARNAGITDRSALILAVAVAGAESNCTVTRHNPVRPDDSYCAWQINMIDELGPQRRATYQLASNEALYDWATCARVMVALSAGGTNWAPWSTYANGLYRAYLADATAAVDSLLAGATPDAVPSGNLIALPPQFCDPGVDCRLDASFAPGVVAMLQDIPGGLRITSAYRSPEMQAVLYARNCPGGVCSVMTAEPGSSLHERGLAVDIRWPDGPSVGYRDADWLWLKVYGGAYGLHNELGADDPLHWSRTGR